MKIKYALLLSLLLIFSACSDKKKDEIKTDASKEQKANKPKPIKYPIKLSTTSGNFIDINKTQSGFKFLNIKNKAILLTFIASWCPPCKAEIPHLNNLQKEYKDNLKIVAVLLEDKSLEDIKSFIKKYDIKFALTHGKSNFILAKAVGDVQTIPFTILYDKSGNYATHYVGAVPEEMMNIDIKKVVK